MTDVVILRAAGGDGEFPLVGEFQNRGNIGRGLGDNQHVRRVDGGPLVTGIRGEGCIQSSLTDHRAEGAAVVVPAQMKNHDQMTGGNFVTIQNCSLVCCQ